MTHVHKRLKPHPHGAGKIAEHCLAIWPPEWCGSVVHIVSRVGRAKRGNRSESVRERHYVILAMWLEGWTLGQIAKKLGYRDHTTPWHHINGRCRCGA